MHIISEKISTFPEVLNFKLAQSQTHTSSSVPSSRFSSFIGSHQFYYTAHVMSSMQRSKNIHKGVRNRVTLV